MFVIMDIEWFEGNQKKIHPTQIAALRVNETWEIIGQYTALIRPTNNATAPWGEIAFTGYSFSDFMAGRSEEQALSCLSQWLLPDDVLLWWAEIPEETFWKVASRHSNIAFPQRSKCLRAAVNSIFIMKGNAYSLAKNRGIPIPYQQHVSINDVLVIQKLLHDVALNPEYIDSPPPKKFRISKKQAAQFPYWYDAVGKLVHIGRGDCLRADMKLEGHRTVWKSGVNVLPALISPQ